MPLCITQGYRQHSRPCLFLEQSGFCQKLRGLLASAATNHAQKDKGNTVTRASRQGSRQGLVFSTQVPSWGFQRLRRLLLNFPCHGVSPPEHQRDLEQSPRITLQLSSSWRWEQPSQTRHAPLFQFETCEVAANETHRPEESFCTLPWSLST